MPFVVFAVLFQRKQRSFTASVHQAGQAFLHSADDSVFAALAGIEFEMRTGLQDELAALEHGVKGEGAKGPHLLQTAGIRYEVDTTRPEGSRVVKAEIIGQDGKKLPLDLKARYVTALTDYLSGGGDGFAMLTEVRVVESSEPLVADVLDGCIRSHSPIQAPEGGRLVRVK